MGFKENLQLLSEMAGVKIPEWWKPNKRHPQLISLTGKYDLNPTIDLLKVPSLVYLLLEANGMGTLELLSGLTPKGERLGKWLLKSHVPEKLISDTFNAVCRNNHFELSTDYNDILRMSESKHVESCLSNSSKHRRAAQRLFYLADPNMGVIVIRDSKGQFLYRRVVHLASLDNKNVLCINKPYGNGPDFTEIKKILEQKIPTYNTQFHDYKVATRLDNHNYLKHVELFRWEDANYNNCESFDYSFNAS